MALPLLVFVTFAVFVLVSLMPGNPARILAGANPSLVPYITKELGLNKPLMSRYWDWLSAAIGGNLGQSYVQHESVDSALWAALPITASLITLSLVISSVTAFVAGLAAALRVGRITDRVIGTISALAIAAPPFWIGYLFVLWFAIDVRWLPALGYESPSNGIWAWISHLILPAVTLSLWTSAILTLQLRGAMLDVLGRPYILSARAKGLGGVAIIGKHALKNSAAPVVTVLGFQLAQLIGGTVLVEDVFSLPGLGKLALTSTLDRDVPVMLGLVVLTTLVVIAVNFLVDLSYGYFNPKVRVS